MLHSFVLKQKRILNGDIYKNSISYSDFKQLLEEINQNSLLAMTFDGRIWANLDGNQFSFIFLKISKIFFAADHQDKLQIMKDFLPGNILYIMLVEAEKSLKIFNSKNIAICCNSLAVLFGCNPPLIENLIIAASQQLAANLNFNDATPQALVDVVNNLAQLNIIAPTIDLNKIINKFTNTKILFIATPQELAKMANAIAKLNLPEMNNNLDLIINRFAQEEMLNKCNHKDLSNMIDAIVRTNFYATSSEASSSNSLKIASQSSGWFNPQGLNARFNIKNLIVIIEKFTQPIILEFANPDDLAIAATAIAKFDLVGQVAELIKIIDEFNLDSILYSASAKHLADIIEAIAKFHISMKIANFGKILRRFTILMRLHKVNYKEANIAAGSVAEIVLDQDINNLEKMIECGVMHLFEENLEAKCKNYYF